MSDWYQAVAVCDVLEDESQSLANSVIERLVSDGIIEAELYPHAVLGGDGGYRPGRSIPVLYEREGDEGDFRSLLTNGVEVRAERWVNFFGFTILDGFACPGCFTKHKQGGNAVTEAFYDATVAFLNGGEAGEVACTACGKSTAIRQWKTVPNLCFANLAFQFWNWPPLDYSAWKTHIPSLVKSIVGREVITTYGRV